MNMISNENFNRRLDKHIKDAFKNHLRLSHSCEHQRQHCLKGSECPLIGLPNDMCIYYVKGRCRYEEQCRYKHLNIYANVYQKAKQQFQIEEKKPLAIIRRYFKDFLPYLTWIFGIIFGYIIRKILDSIGKQIF